MKITQKQKLLNAFKGIDDDESALDMFNKLNKNPGIVQINNQKGRIEAGEYISQQFTWDRKKDEHVLYEFKGDEE